MDVVCFSVVLCMYKFVFKSFFILLFIYLFIYFLPARV